MEKDLPINLGKACLQILRDPRILSDYRESRRNGSIAIGLSTEIQQKSGELPWS